MVAPGQRQQVPASSRTDERPASGGHPFGQSNLSTQSGGAEWVDLRDIWRKLWRGRKLIIAFTILGTLVCAFAISQLTPKYTATNAIMLETRERRVFEAEAVLPDLVFDDAIVGGEVQVIFSRELAKRVATDLNLFSDSELNRRFYQADSVGLFGQALALFAGPDDNPAQLVGETTSAVSAGDNNTQSNGGTRPDDPAWLTRGTNRQQTSELPLEVENQNLQPGEVSRLQKIVVDAMLDRLHAKQVADTPIIQISFTSEDPQTAMRIANAYAENYLVAQIDLKSSETRQANEWLEERITLLRTEVEETERSIEELRAETGLVTTAQGEESVADQQVRELSSQLIEATLERQRAESQLQQNVDTELEASAVTQELRLAEEQFSRELAERSTEFGPAHPVIINLRQSLSETRASIAAERSRVVTRLESEVESARQRESELERSYNEISGNLKETGSNQVQIRALERDVEAKRALLESFLARAQETSQQEGTQRPDAWIISFAEVPAAPSFPNNKLFLLLGFFGSAFAGVSVSYLWQSLDKSFQTVDQVKSQIVCRSIHIVPKVPTQADKMKPARFVVKKPNSAYAEALRNLQVSIYAARTPPRIILFTSSVPGEGKTALATSFARFLALNKLSTVIVDCDLRKPSVHHVLRGERSPGLTDYLSGKMQLSETIQVDSSSKLRFIAAGSQTSRPSELLTTKAMRTAMDALGQYYDVVILDSAPILAVADTRVLLRYAHHTEFVIRWRSTHQKAVDQALSILETAGLRANAMGTLLNLVDTQQYREYDEFDYFQAGKSYYVD